MTSEVEDPPIQYLGARSRAAAQWKRSDHHALGIALAPLSLMYGAVVDWRRRAYARGVLQSIRVTVPVISVGNLAVGGAGKTPVTGWLVERLAARGQRPAVLHGGYAADEPALHRSWQPDIPVYLGKDRVASANRAIQNGATVLVLDDGMQHLRLARDLDLVLISADSWEQPKRLLPAGSWRERLDSLRDVEIIAITRKAASHTAAAQVAAEIRASTGGHAPCIIALKLDQFQHVNASAARPGGAVIALSSIADPLAFARQLVQAGLEVSTVLAFGDHHEYRQPELDVVRARARGRPVVTTEKDAVKLKSLDPTFDFWIARQSVVFEAGLPQLDAAVEAALLMPRSA